MEIIIESKEALGSAAQQFIEQITETSVITFYGTMGVGKTTFIKEVCAQLGVKDEVTSPTFAIINEYIGNNNSTIFHFDLYRLDTISDAQNIGVEDYLYSGNKCLIEWPEIIEPILPTNTLKVYITELSNGIRKISF